MVMTALREGASGGMLKYFLLGILCLAAGGLVFTDVGGFFRGGVTSTDAAKVGDEKISINRFDRQVRRSLSRLGMSPQQAYQVGYVQEILNNEMRSSLLKQEAANIGAVISTEEIAGNIQKIIQPMTQPGQKPQDVLRQLLSSQGISEGEMIESMRSEMAVNLIGSSVQAGFAKPSPLLARDLDAFEKEQRNVQYIVFKDQDFKDAQEPADEQLQSFYEGTKEAYAKPELREGQLAIIKTSGLKDTLEISDEEIKDIYERQISAYSEPEKREIEQVILSEADKADEIAAAVQDGTALKEAVKSATGNTTDYLPAKDVEKIELLDELQDEVFAAKEKDVLGPIESGLGHHVVVVKKIKAAHTQSFDAVKKSIKEELMETRLLDAQYDLANTVEDMLASGADLATLGEEVDLEIKDLKPSNTMGSDANGKPAFKDFGSDAATLLSTLFELGEGEASPVIELADGRMATLYVKSITPKSYKPFDEVKASIKKRWMNDAQRAGNKMRILEVLASLQGEEGTTLKEAAIKNGKSVQSLSKLSRKDEAKAPLTPSALNAIFEAPQGSPIALDLDGAAAIALVTDVSLPKTQKDADIENVEKNILGAYQNEAYTLYVENLRKQYGVRVNQPLLEAVYGQRDAQ